MKYPDKEAIKKIDDKAKELLTKYTKPEALQMVSEESLNYMNKVREYRGDDEYQVLHWHQRIAENYHLKLKLWEQE